MKLLMVSCYTGFVFFAPLRSATSPLITSQNIICFHVSFSIVLFEMSQILKTGLDKTQLSILVALSECGVSPQVLTEIVKDLQNEKVE